MLMGNAAMVVKDREIALIIRTALDCASYECMTFVSMVSLFRGIKRDGLSLVVMDVDDRDQDWRSIVEWRRNWLNPAVVVIAIGADDAKSAAQALEAGMDDYVAKPVRGAELLARIHAATRRRESGARARHVALTLAGCTIDRNTCALRSSRANVPLTSRELAVTQILFENAGKVVTRHRLAAEIWGASPDLAGRTIQQHVYQVRGKLKRCIGEELHVRCIYGSGYRLEVARSTPTDAARQDGRFAAAAPRLGLEGGGPKQGGLAGLWPLQMAFS
jgi:DNA-binding response OmpR family regulator